MRIASITLGNLSAATTVAAMTALLAGCVTPPRDARGPLRFVDAGPIEASQGAGFSDCVADGFAQAWQRGPLKRHLRRNADGLLVAVYADDGTLLTGTTVSGGGHAERWETEAGRQADLSAERDAFDTCLAQFIPSYMVFGR